MCVRGGGRIELKEIHYHTIFDINADADSLALSSSRRAKKDNSQIILTCLSVRLRRKACALKKKRCKAYVSATMILI